MKTIRSTVSKFPVEVVSEDEREMVERKEHYLVVKPDWRSSDAENLYQVLDALHMASHFTADDRPRPGRFSHPRTSSRRLYTGPAPPGLPSNLYKRAYLESLTPDELEDLKVQPDTALMFPARIMRFVFWSIFEHRLTVMTGLLLDSAIFNAVERRLFKGMMPVLMFILTVRCTLVSNNSFLLCLLNIVSYSSMDHRL